MKRGSVKCTQEQLLHAMQVHFQQLYASQLQKFKKDGIGSNKGNSIEVALRNVKFRGTCYYSQKKGHKASDCPDKENSNSKISQPVLGNNKTNILSRANASVKRVTKEYISQRKSAM